MEAKALAYSTKLSDIRIRSATNYWSNQVKTYANKIRRKNEEAKLLNDALKGINKKLNNSQYNKFQSAYNNENDKVKELKDTLNKSKSSHKKSSINEKLNNLMRKKSEYSSQMASLAKEQGFYRIHSRKVRKQANIKHINKLISDLKKQKAKAKNKYNYYRNTMLTRQRIRTQKKNSVVINQKIKDAKSNGASVLYRTDLMDDTVFNLYETSPTETDSNTVATHATDSNVAQTNYVSLDSRELSGTYILEADDLKSADQQFKKLMLWSRHYEFTIDGFAYWQHAYITSIAKSTDQTMNKNAMSIEISFSYAQQAQIQYAKLTAKRKAPAGKIRGSRNSNSSKRYMRIKPGWSYAVIARKTGTSITDLERINKWSATKVPSYANVRWQ